jgi:hypothetical protein
MSIQASSIILHRSTVCSSAELIADTIEFGDNSCNCGCVIGSGIFTTASCNMGFVKNLILCDQSINCGGTYETCCLLVNYEKPTNRYNPNSPCSYYTFTSGNQNTLHGFYATEANNCILIYLNQSSNEAPPCSNRYAVQNSVCEYGSSGYFCYLNGGVLCLVGAQCDFYYTTISSTSVSALVCYCGSAVQLGFVDTSFNCTSPISVDGYYFVYCNGSASMATNGAYSMAYICDGIALSGYTSYIPEATLDTCEIKFYVSGTACDPACCVRIFENNCIYSTANYYGAFYRFINDICFGFAVGGQLSFTPGVTVPKDKCYGFTASVGQGGEVIFGCFSNDYCGLISTNHSNIPELTFSWDYPFYTSCNYWLFCCGIGTSVADGPYSNGLFSNGGRVSLAGCTGFIPTGVLDLTDCYYTYCSDDTNCWGTADNYYTNGYFIHGAKQNVSSPTCQIAVNDGLCYCYNGYDVIAFNIKNGFYSDFRYVNDVPQTNRCIVNGVKTWAQVYQQNDPVVNGVANSAGWIYGDGGSGYDPYCYAYRDAVTNVNDGNAYLKHSTTCGCATSNGCNGTNATWSCAYDSLCYGFTFIELKYHDTLGYQNVADTFAFTSYYCEQSCTCVSLYDQYGSVTGSCYDYNNCINCACVWFYFSNGSPDGHLTCYWNYSNGVEVGSYCCRLNGDSNFYCALANFVTINYL